MKKSNIVLFKTKKDILLFLVIIVLAILTIIVANYNVSEGNNEGFIQINGKSYGEISELQHKDTKEMILNKYAPDDIKKTCKFNTIQEAREKTGISLLKFENEKNATNIEFIRNGVGNDSLTFEINSNIYEVDWYYDESINIVPTDYIGNYSFEKTMINNLNNNCIIMRDENIPKEYEQYLVTFANDGIRYTITSESNIDNFEKILNNLKSS